MIHDVIARWHDHLHGEPEVLDQLLDDDVVFHSPVVFTPQQGKAITSRYLTAAVSAFVGRPGDEPRSTPFVYTKKILSGDTAVLEFETSMDGRYVNGVDIIRINEAGRIVEFRVMVRPLQAVNTVHRMMGLELEGMGNP